MRILHKLNWDRNISDKELLSVLTGSATLTPIFFVRSLESLSWTDLTELWDIESCKKLYNSRTRRMIRSKCLREKYDAIFGILSGHDIPEKIFSEDDRTAQRNFLLAARLNREKKTRFTSPLFRDIDYSALENSLVY